MITPEQRARAEALHNLGKEQEAVIAYLQTDLEQTIQDARDGLVPIPVPGEPWSGLKNYITGDEVTDEGVVYIAKHWSKNRKPSENPEQWSEKAQPSLPEWSSIPDGTIIYEGDQVTHSGKNWEATQQHTKSVVYTPKTGSSRWVEI